MYTACWGWCCSIRSTVWGQSALSSLPPNCVSSLEVLQLFLSQFIQPFKSSTLIWYIWRCEKCLPLSWFLFFSFLHVCHISDPHVITWNGLVEVLTWSRLRCCGMTLNRQFTERYEHIFQGWKAEIISNAQNEGVTIILNMSAALLILPITFLMTLSPSLVLSLIKYIMMLTVTAW